MYKVRINVHTLSQWKSNFLIDEYTELSNFNCSDLMLMKTFFLKKLRVTCKIMFQTNRTLK